MHCMKNFAYVVLLMIISSYVDGGVDKIDLTVFQNSRFIDLSSDSDVQYLGYVSKNYIDSTTFNIGRTSDTGTGKVGNEVVNPKTGTLPSDSGFPTGSSVTYSSQSSFQHININLDGANQAKGRVGAFYVTAEDAVHQKVQITTIKSAQDASVVPQNYVYTITTSIGESVNLEVQTSLKDLRWSHNGGPSITEWVGKAKVTLENVRKADEGIYECYNDGDHEQGKHAIMRLIVRGCSTSKYGPQCESTCATCYNGGICHDTTGICICPPGFQGLQCEEACGENNWGAFCSIKCSSNGNCNGKSFCVPDPVGCSCMAGFTGKECNEVCSSNSYGAGCNETCRCSSGCSSSRGCTDADTCIKGYGGPQCQVPTGNCSKGNFGELCNIRCHCLDGVTCNKSSGVCSNGQCAEGWAGTDCQNALPVLYDSPTVQIEHEVATVDWQSWNINIDYGTGPVDVYKLYYGINGEGFTHNILTSKTEEIISDLKVTTDYNFAISCYLTVDGASYEGPQGNLVKSTTGCRVPTDSPTIESIKVLGTTSVEVTWKVPSGEEWIGCSLGIESFIITFNPENSPDDKTVHNVDDINARKVTIDSLAPCTTYEFVIHITNRDHQGPDSKNSLATTNGVAPGRVQSLTVTTPSHNSLDVSWNEPSHQCKISHYNVTHQLKSLDQCSESQNAKIYFKTSTTTSALITGLQSYSTYHINVTAWSDDLKGGPEISSGRTGESSPSDHPSKVKHEAFLHELSFTWDLPPCGTRCGQINKYEYIFGKFGAQNSSGSTTDKGVSFLELKSNSMYKFQVRAVTSAGSGPYTEGTGYSTSKSQGGERMNGGVVASIIIGVVVGSLCIFSGILYCVKREREKRKKEEEERQKLLDDKKKAKKLLEDKQKASRP